MIVSESGRATVSHHAVLVFNVLHARKFEPPGIPATLPDNCSEALMNLMDATESLTPRNVQEIYHDAVYYRDEIREQFLHGNASLRERSLAIDQLFPVMPIHRHRERPRRQAVLADITCDSDGKIDAFIDLHDVKRTLPLHVLNEEEYYLGAFLSK